MVGRGWTVFQKYFRRRAIYRRKTFGRAGNYARIRNRYQWRGRNQPLVQQLLRQRAQRRRWPPFTRGNQRFYYDGNTYTPRRALVPQQRVASMWRPPTRDAQVQVQVPAQTVVAPITTAAAEPKTQAQLNRQAWIWAFKTAPRGPMPGRRPADTWFGSPDDSMKYTFHGDP